MANTFKRISSFPFEIFTLPPAARTIGIPAATSQIAISSSLYASTEPLATNDSDRAALPNNLTFLKFYISEMNVLNVLV